MGDAPSGRSTAPPMTAASVAPLDPTRRTIADRLAESYQEAVHVTVRRYIDARELLAAQRGLREAARDGSILDIVISALSSALAENPRFNATFDGDELTTYEEHNVAIAVDTERGLFAPVLADVRDRRVDDINRERRTLTGRVQAGEQSMADLRGGTITATNLGPLEVDAFTPIINPPQVAILSLNRLRDRVVLAEGDPIEVAELPLGVTFDHRVVDGADAGRLLGSIAAELTTATDLVAD